MIEMNTREQYQGYFAFKAMAEQLVEMGENVGKQVFANIVNTLIGE